MNTKYFVIFIAIVIATNCYYTFNFMNSCKADVLPKFYVDDDYNSGTPGWGYDHFDKIQDGIDGVAENGTVYVKNGTYYENVVVNKTIDLIGENKETTIIDGGGSGDVVYISADQVKISGFKIKGSGASGTNGGLHIISDYNIVDGNILCYNNEDGIKLWQANHNILQNMYHHRHSNFP